MGYINFKKGGIVISTTMKIPNKIQMFGKVWKIKRVKSISSSNSGGDFSFKNREIRISTKYGEQEEILLHEMAEAVLLHLHFRFYGQEGNMEYRFYFDHSGYTIFMKTFHGILKDNKLI